jgi:hypothetical protein
VCDHAHAGHIHAKRSANSRKPTLYAMNKQIKKYGLLILAFLICACLNYNPQMLFETSYRHWGWNFSLIATFLILIIFRLRDPLDWKQKLGIDFNLADWFRFFVLTISLLFASYFLVDYLSEINGYSFRPKIIHYKDYNPPDFHFSRFLGIIYITFLRLLNEEILLEHYFYWDWNELSRNWTKILLRLELH